MGQLDAGGGALGVQEIDDAGEGGDMLVLPQAQIGIGNAALGGNAGGFEDHQAKAANGKAPEMDQMPVIGEAVLRRILAHGGDDRAVAQGQAAQGGRGKQLGHEILLSLFGGKIGA
jgi:hypothetical protein